MRNKKILYGICGIGLGHSFRQLPIIEELAKENKILIFAYGKSYEFYSDRFKDAKNISMQKVAVPFYVGGNDGIDFFATAVHPCNKQDFLGINGAANDYAKAHFGVADLVITDYEPISAQYAYANNIPLITIDQQTKYLIGDFPQEIDGKNFKDEVMRLRMLLPLAHKRIICSFFAVKSSAQMPEAIVIPPIIRDKVLELERSPMEKRILVYLTSNDRIAQSSDDILAALAAIPAQCHVFADASYDFAVVPSNVRITYDKKDFLDELGHCSGIISTAGHTLLSEAIHLGIPVYAIPLDIYEQRMNAKVIHDNGFGLMHHEFDAEMIAAFVCGIPTYTANITNDRTVLLRSSGKNQILELIEEVAGK